MPNGWKPSNFHNDCVLEEQILKTERTFSMFRKQANSRELFEYKTRVVKLYLTLDENCCRPNHVAVSPSGTLYGIAYHIPYRELKLQEAGLPKGWNYYYSHGGACIRCGRSKSEQKRTHGHCGQCDCQDCLSGDDETEFCQCGKISTSPYGQCSTCEDESIRLFTVIRENEAASIIQKYWRRKMSDKWYSEWLERILGWIINNRSDIRWRINKFKLNPKAEPFIPKKHRQNERKSFRDPRRRSKKKKTIIRDGECYLRLFHVKDRERIRALYSSGPPDIDTLVDRHCGEMLQGWDLIFYEVDENTLHVTKSDGFRNLKTQAKRVYSLHRYSKVGSTVPIFDLGKFEKRAEQSPPNIECSYRMSDILEVNEDLEAGLPLQAEVTPSARKPIYVGGSGFCWKDIAIGQLPFDPECDHVTARDIVMFVKNVDRHVTLPSGYRMPRKNGFWNYPMSYEKQSDGDYHVFPFSRTCMLQLGKQCTVDEFVSELEKELQDLKVFVKGGGTCWQKLGDAAVTGLWGKDQNNISISDLLPILTDKNAFGSWIPFLKIETQDDGDLHLADAVWQNNQSYETKETPEGYMRFEEAIDFLKKHEYKEDKETPVLVGKGAIDQAREEISSNDMKMVIDNFFSDSLRQANLMRRTWCPYQIKPDLEEYAEKYGFPYSRMNAIPHDHALHASARLRQCAVVFPSLIKGDCTVSFMNDANYEMLLEHTKDDIEISRVNCMVDIKDPGRYGGIDLSAEVFTLPNIETPYALWHDNGHYLTPGNMLHLFEKNPKLMVLVVSHIYPLSALYSRYSPEPKLYTYTKEAGMLFYVPEGHHGHVYCQPEDPSLLLAQTISNKELTMKLNVGIVDSKMNCHVQVITRFELKGEKGIALESEPYFQIPRILRRMPNDLDPIPLTLWRKLYMYAKSLGASQAKNTHAKIRQMVKVETQMFGIKVSDILAKVIIELMKHDPYSEKVSKYYDSFAGKILYNTSGRFQAFLHQSFKGKYTERWYGMLDEGSQLTIIPKVHVRCKMMENRVMKHEWLIPEESRMTMINQLKWWFRVFTGGRVLKKAEAESYITKTGLVVGLETVFPPLTQAIAKVKTKDGIMRDQANAFLKMLHQEDKIPRTGDEIPLTFGEAEEDKWKVTTFNLNEILSPDVTKRYENYISDQTTIGSALKRSRNADNDCDEIVEDICIRSCKRHKVAKESSFESDLMSIAESALENRIPLASNISHSESVHRKIKKIPKRVIPPPFMMVPENVGEDPGNYRTQGDVPQIHVDQDRPDRGRVLQGLADSAKRRKEMRFLVEPGDISNTIEITPDMVKQYDEKGKAKARETQAEISEHFDKMMTEPIGKINVTAPNPKVWWDLAFPKSAGRRHHVVPFWPVVSFPPGIRYPDNDCALQAVLPGTRLKTASLMAIIARAWPKGQSFDENSLLSILNLEVLALHHEWDLVMRMDGMTTHYGINGGSKVPITLVAGHFAFDKKARIPIRIKDRVSEKKVPKEESRILNDLSELESIQWVDYPISLERAVAYLRALHAGKAGSLGDDPQNLSKIKAWENLCEMRHSSKKTIKLAFIEGDPGCAKSFPVVSKLAKHIHNNVFNFAVPTQVAREDNAKKMRLTEPNHQGIKAPPDVCDTWENMLAKRRRVPLMVYDEDKYPSGYFDAFALISEPMTSMIFMCDRNQGRYHDPKKDSPLNSIPTNGQHMSMYSRRYAVGSYRFGPEIGNLLCIPVFRSYSYGGIKFGNKIPGNCLDLKELYPEVDDTILNEWLKNSRVVYPARARVDMADTLTSDSENDTFAAVQGLTLDIIFIVVDQPALAVVDNGVTYNCLTRSPRVVIIPMFIYDGRANQALSTNIFWNTIFKYKNSLTNPWDTLVPSQDRTIDVRVLGDLLTSQVEIVLAGDPTKVLNRNFVEPLIPYVDWEKWYDPFREVSKGGFRIGKKIDEDPIYKEEANFGVNFFGVPDEIMEYDENPPELVIYPEVKIITSLPIETKHGWIEDKNSEVREKHSREIWKNGYSNQMPDAFMYRRDAAEQRERFRNKIFPGVPRREAERNLQKHIDKLKEDEIPWLFKPEALAWAQYQLSSDEVSFAAGLAQRIRRQSREANRLEHAYEIPLGRAMWDRLCEYLQWDKNTPFAFDREFFNQCEIEFHERRLARSGDLKKMALNRSDPDYVDLLTAKTQVKLKDLVPADAKPLQMILVRSDAYIAEYGPYGVYLLEKILQNVPDYVYIHAKKSIAEMMDWTKKHGKLEGKMHFMTDVKALDQSERGADCELATLLFRYFGFPEEKIESYLNDKYDFKTATIHFGLMRFSGEIFTFLMNTIFVLARILVEYAFKPGDPLKIAGDDVKGYRIPSKRPEFKELKHMDHCEIKEEHNEVGNFCSYVEQNGMVMKDPRILLKRLLVASEMGKLKDVIDGYYLDFMTIYRLGDRIHEFGEEICAAQQILANDIFNLRRVHRFNWQMLTELPAWVAPMSSDWDEYIVKSISNAMILSESEPESEKYTLSYAKLEDTSVDYE